MVILPPVIFSTVLRNPAQADPLFPNYNILYRMLAMQADKILLEMGKGIRKNIVSDAKIFI